MSWGQSPGPVHTEPATLAVHALAADIALIGICPGGSPLARRSTRALRPQEAPGPARRNREHLAGRNGARIKAPVSVGILVLSSIPISAGRLRTWPAHLFSRRGEHSVGPKSWHPQPRRLVRAMWIFGEGGWRGNALSARIGLGLRLQLLDPRQRLIQRRACGHGIGAALQPDADLC